MRNIRQNFFFAFIYTLLGVPIAARVLLPIVGILLSPLTVSAALSLSSVPVIGNALSLGRASLFLALLIFLCPSSPAFGHGFDKPGPHGGIIQMPGAFHTELVPNGDLDFRVYLLDTEIKNPTTRKSALSGYLQKAEQTEKIECIPNKEYFDCKLPRAIRDGEKIFLKANRRGVSGGLAVYPAPLKIPK